MNELWSERDEADEALAAAVRATLTAQHEAFLAEMREWNET
jgi:hypothetical protein